MTTYPASNDILPLGIEYKRLTGTVARYDLSKQNISFDFFAWQAHAVLLGAKEIVFKVSNGFGQHKEDKRRLKERYRSIIKPGPALLGLPSREGDDGEDCATHKLYGILSTGRHDFPRLKSILPPGDAKYTVTLRRCPHRQEQNSDIPLWTGFAKEIGATIIDDYYRAPIELHERVALYAGAEMNFGVVNGPLALCYLSTYPMMMFDCASRAFAWEKHGIPAGTQLPFAYPRQRLVWQRPQSVRDIFREFDKLC